LSHPQHPCGFVDEVRENKFHEAVNRSTQQPELMKQENQSALDTSVSPGAETHSSYCDLERFGRESLTADNRSLGQIANFRTALNSWREVHQREMNCQVGADFGTAFDRLFLHYQDIQGERISPRTLQDRCEQLLWWRRTLEAMRGKDTLPASFCGALTVAFERSGLTKSALCRDAGISKPTFDRWLSKNHLPERSSSHLIGAVENALDLSPGTLARRLPARRRARYERGGDKPTSGPQTAYGGRLQRNKQKLKPFSLAATPRIMAQWREVLALKTDLDRDGATLRNSWRIKPPERVGIRVHWSMVIDGGICVTAHGQYQQLMSFLGFLALTPAQGGFETPKNQLDTLAWLVRADRFLKYLKWVRRRSDNILHNGLFTLLDTIRAHLRPKTGYVWLTPALAATLPDEEWPLGRPNAQALVDVWQLRCSAAYDTLMDYTRKLKAEGKTQKSRDPKVVFQDIVASEFPMRELVRLIQDIENDPPPVVQKRNYAIWVRDVLLLKMLNRHPLRAHHFSIMTFRGPASNLSRVGSGWQLHFDAADFKNEKSATTSPYTVLLDRSLVLWLNRYLSEARPLMVEADECNFLFLPSREGNRVQSPSTVETGIERTGAWTPGGIYSRIKSLTALYRSNGIGLNIHGFRHVAATDHLKRHPREYAVVAKILNDKLETVIREYDHTEMQDGARTLSSSIEEAESALRKEKGQP